MFYKVKKSSYLGHEIYNGKDLIGWVNIIEGMVLCKKYQDEFKMKENCRGNTVVKLEIIEDDHVRYEKRVYNHCFRSTSSIDDWVRYLMFNDIDLDLIYEKLEWD